MVDKRVTCIMTVYKKYTYIYRAIDSILKQTYSNIELIICDDCSGDFPEQNIIEYINKNKRQNIKNILVYSNKENLGTVKNFNTAIKNASGFYFIGLSSDDIFYNEDVIKKVVICFNETGAEYATCRAAMETQDKRNGLCFQTEKNIDDIKTMNANQLFNRISKDNIVLGASTYFTSVAIEKYGYYDEQYIYIEDLSRFLSLCRQGAKIAFFDIVSIWHTMDGISNSSSIPKRYIQDNLNICKNEILCFKDRLSFMSYRYNLCRKKTLEYKIKNDGVLLLTDKIIIFICYPDAILYNVYVSFKRHFSKRIQIDREKYEE